MFFRTPQPQGTLGDTGEITRNPLKFMHFVAKRLDNRPACGNLDLQPHSIWPYKSLKNPAKWWKHRL